MKLFYIFIAVFVIGCKTTPEPKSIKPKEGEIYLPPVKYSMIKENPIEGHQKNL